MENYYKEIKRIRLLSQEEEVILSKEIKKGDKASLEILIKHNLRLVLKISQSYQNVGLDFEDVVAEGNVGLIEAATRYDGDKGNRFSTYASWWIKQAILYAISQKGRQIRLPMNVINDMRKILGKVEIEKSVSLDTTISEDDDRSIANFLPAECKYTKDENLEHAKFFVKKCINYISERDREIVLAYYGIDREYEMSKDDISERYGLTRTRVNQILKSSLQSIKVKLGVSS
jgi:RNA polymerase primary sigma factor